MILRNCLLILLAVLQIYFLILEMVLWSTPRGLKVFRMSAEQAKDRQVLAANQGLYNGFLAAGLIWALLAPDPSISRQVALFFSGCVLVAGLYGAYSVSRKILIVQAIPALVTLLASYFIF